MNNSNLEFRKIPSLGLLYEINENGTILRNIKSKKQTKIFLDLHHSKYGYYAAFVNTKGKCKRVMIHSAVAECWLGPKPDGLEIDHIDRNAHNNHHSNLRYVTHSEQMKNRVLGEHVIDAAKANCAKYVASISVKVVIDGIEHSSMTAGARYLAALHGKSTEHMRAKLKKRRSNVYGHDVIYLNAETRRTHPKG